MTTLLLKERGILHRFHLILMHSQNIHSETIIAVHLDGADLLVTQTANTNHSLMENHLSTKICSRLWRKFLSLMLVIVMSSHLLEAHKETKVSITWWQLRLQRTFISVLQETFPTELLLVSHKRTVAISTLSV